VLLLLGAALVLRVWKLGNLPGCNGDEAWYGVQALRLLQGESIAWFTPTGNPINVFYFGPLVLLHACFEPSFALLRAVAAASGILMLLVNFVLCRRMFDELTAWTSTLLLAVLPVNIAYSRFGWDASQSVLATIVVMYLGFELAHRPLGRRKLPLGLAALGAAVLVHPTNVFAAVLLLAPCCVSRMRSHLGNREIGLGCSLAVVAAALATVTFAPAHFVAFSLNYVRLFSGATEYRFISGALPEDFSPSWRSIDAWDLSSLTIVLAAGLGFHRISKAERGQRDWGLLLGWATSLLAFYFVAGAGAIAPHFERYALCLVGPAALLFVRGMIGWSAGPVAIGASRPEVNHRHAALASVGVVAWLLLAGFYTHYILFFETTGGRGHMAFRTGPIEPKQQALENVLRQAGAGAEPISIVADSWWTYWPVRYLAPRQVRVVRLEDWNRDSSEQGPGRADRMWFVEFISPEQSVARADRPDQSQAAYRGLEVLDYSGNPLILVTSPSMYAPCEEPARNY